MDKNFKLGVVFFLILKTKAINCLSKDRNKTMIIFYFTERVSNQKRLRGGVRFIKDIPKNPSGKILRRELRNLLKSKL